MASEFPKDTIGQPPSGGGMIGRIQRLLISPKTEWAAIDAEPMTVQGILTGWVAPLAAIGPIASLIQSQMFPVSIFGMTWRPPLVGSIVGAALHWVLAIALTYVCALIIDALAPSFGGTKNPISALKVAAFSMTAGWLGAILGILPFLGMLAILFVLYNFYLLWIGGPMLMKVPQDKAPGFVVVSVLVTIVAWIVAAFVAGAIAAAMFSMAPGTGVLGTPGGSVTIGGTTIDTGKLEAQTAAIKASTEKLQASLAGNGTAKAVDPTALQNLIPASLSGWNRTSIKSEGVGAGGIGGSNASAQFQSGDQSFSLSVTDLGVIGNLATLGGAVNTSSNEQTATGYKKSEMKDGNAVSEEWDNQAKSGKYSMIANSRFQIEASGSAPSIDVLKAAVASVNVGQLQSLAN